ncbi:Uncharacterized protein FWK35_00002152 [Aphis craccivora]|uniref:Uncharacterized protein n=1 Tax=Aphis craccivora TaxID=307492 RepID=A0A6G0ZR17_APHCR|nr:Uncharacterized protein FWK35_00002152 [Aphis craccivora]
MSFTVCTLIFYVLDSDDKLTLTLDVSNKITSVLDSERSDECIDFTMMCVFFVVVVFVSVYSITS